MISDQEAPEVVIVGAGPAGLATSACLTLHSIPHILLEREDCYASLWSKYSYDTLHLNLSKSFSKLPHFPLPSSYPKFLSRDQFLSYLDAYISRFGIRPVYNRRVELAYYDEGCERWVVRARNLMELGEFEEYKGRFLVVAIGKNTDPYVPEIEGLCSFHGDVVHSTRYKNGKGYHGKTVLVVGCGSSGIDVALVLAESGAMTSIIVHRPNTLLLAEDKRPVFDAGTCAKIKSGEIQVLQTKIARVRGNEASFEDGRAHTFDAMVLCTGFKRPVKMWIKGDDTIFNEDGTAKLRSTNNWKGKNGLYAHGLSSKGLIGINEDAQNIANDIKLLFS